MPVGAERAYDRLARAIRVAICVVSCCARLAPFASAQSATDIIRGRVTGPDSLPIAGARITATSYAGNISKRTDTDNAGRFQLIFINGEGDYWIDVVKLGFARRRFEIRKVGEEQIMTADARLTSAIARLDGVSVVAGNRALINRNAAGTDIGGGSRTLDTGAPEIPADQAGNLAAMASGAPGIQRIPGMGSFADMFSAFGLSGDQNSIRVNGLGSAVSTLPPDAQVRVTFNQFPADVANGGFSGAQLSLQSIPGSNVSYRGVTAFGTGPYFQLTDQGANASGQKSTTMRLSSFFRGPIRPDEAFYNVSYSAQRNFADNLTLLNTGLLGLQSAGIAGDSAARLIAILSAKGIPTTSERSPRLRTIDNLSYQANFDLIPSSSGTGNAFTLDVIGGYVRVQPTASSVSMLARTPGQSNYADSWYTSASLMHSNYFAFGVLSQTTLGVSLQQRTITPFLAYPTGTVRVGSRLADGTTSIVNLSFGGGDPAAATSNRNIQLLNQLQWFTNDNKHAIKVTSSVSREHAMTDVGATTGSFWFNSLAELQADAPASFTRTTSSNQVPSDQIVAGVSVGDSWRPASTLQVQYGIRADGNRFLYRPAYNPLLSSTFGISNDAVPNRISLSPRIGLQWTYGTEPTVALAPGAARAPLAVVHGVAGFYQNVGSANLIANAVTQTGLPSSTRSLACVGSETPVPEWASYSADISSVPGTCANNSSIFASAVPNVSVFDRQFEQPKSFRVAADWASPVLSNRYVLGLQSVYSWNMNQAGLVDINLDAKRGFTLPSEAQRPVFVAPTLIVPGTGAIAVSASRRDTSFQSVSVTRSDLRSASAQLIAKLSPVTTNKFLHWDATYSLLSVKDEFYGFSGAGNTAGNPFTREWGAHADAGKHQFFVNWSNVPVADLVYITLSAMIKSGPLFTPMVAGDINGDGYLNDRAFVFDPMRTADTLLATGMRSLLANGAASATHCLSAQLHQLAARATCQAPWITTTNLRISLNPTKVRLPKRANIIINVVNPLALADLALHGSGNTRGWGQDIPVDQNLLFVRGFDPVTRQYSYSVNSRFGSTMPQQSATRSASLVSVSMRYDIGFTPERQMLTQYLNVGRTRPGTRKAAGDLKSWGTSSIPNPMLMVLQQSDSLRLTRAQADSLATLSTRFSQLADSVWTSASTALASEPDYYETGHAYERYVAARELTMDFLIAVAPNVRALLTVEQKRRLPSAILNYLDDRVLRFLRSSTAGDGSGILIR